MQLHIRHATSYSYEKPLAYSVQRLHLTPQDHATQTIREWKISAPGIENALSYQDGFGNLVHLITYQNVSGPISIVAEGIVEVTDNAGVMGHIRCAAPDPVFLRQTSATSPSEAILAMAARIAPGGGAVLDNLHSLMNEVHRLVRYTIGTTDVDTTAAQAFAEGQGVCQDHAHIFAGVARHWGFPARYVTGYLALADFEMATASHAWAEALVPGIGWIGFDPANGTCPTDRYVRVAGGIDANGITPIRGSRRGGGNESMQVAVSVGMAQQ